VFSLTLQASVFPALQRWFFEQIHVGAVTH